MQKAPPAEHPKPLAEKIGPAAPVDDPAAKVTKREVKAAADVPPAQPPRPAPVDTSTSTTPVTMGFAPNRHIGDVGDRGHHGDLGTNNRGGAS